MSGFVESLKDDIMEGFVMIVDMFRGELFPEAFEWFSDKCEEEDWNGLIKFLFYPLLAIGVFIGCILFTAVFIITCVVYGLIIVLFIFPGKPLGWFFKKIWQGIIWLDKKLRK